MFIKKTQERKQDCLVSKQASLHTKQFPQPSADLKTNFSPRRETLCWWSIIAFSMLMSYAFSQPSSVSVNVRRALCKGLFSAESRLRWHSLAYDVMLHNFLACTYIYCIHHIVYKRYSTIVQLFF